MTDEIPKPGILVEVAINPNDIEAAKYLLKEILYDPNGFIFSDENDATEQVQYVVAKDGKKVVGASRLRLNPPWEDVEKLGVPAVLIEAGFSPEQFEGNIAWFYGIALDQQYQGSGIGSQLYEARERIAQKNGKNFLITQARPDAQPIYRNREYKQFGEEDVKLGSGEIIKRGWFYKFIDM